MKYIETLLIGTGETGAWVNFWQIWTLKFLANYYGSIFVIIIILYIYTIIATPDKWKSFFKLFNIFFFLRSQKLFIHPKYHTSAPKLKRITLFIHFLKIDVLTNIVNRNKKFWYKKNLLKMWNVCDFSL